LLLPASSQAGTLPIWARNQVTGRNRTKQRTGSSDAAFFKKNWEKKREGKNWWLTMKREQEEFLLNGGTKNTNMFTFVTKRKLKGKRIVSNWWYVDEKKIVTGKRNSGAT
jgi:hypothetical protein